LLLFNIGVIMSQDNKPADWKKGWRLYYWQRYGGANGPTMGGRANVIRVMFELGGAEWEEACKDKNPMEAAKDVLGPNAKFYPNFAMPIVAHANDLVLSQSTNIMLFLGDKFGLSPDNAIERALANQVQLTVYDVFSEISNKRQELNKGNNTEDEKQQTLNEFLNTRFSTFLEFFEAQLKRNNDGKGWFFGNKPTFADVQVADLMRRYELGANDHYKECKFKLLKEHQKRFENVDKVKAFYASNRYPKPFGWLG